MKKLLISLLSAGMFSWSTPTVMAQQAPVAFSLQQSIDYALANQPNMKNAQLQNEIAAARIGQIRSAGLPQINAGVDVGNNVVLQKTLIDPNMFGGGGTQQTTITPDNLNSLNNGQNVVLKPEFVPATDPLPPTTLAFGLKYAGSAAITASQLLFDGAYLIGLKAAKVYTELSRKQQVQTEVDVIDQVTKAYYSVLVSRERLTLLDRNLMRLENQLREITEIYKQGFAEKIDVDRLQVAYNNLKVEKEKATRLVALGVDLLKFQMGMEISQPLELTDKLDNALVEAEIVASRNFDYTRRIEYSILETQRDLAKLDIKNKQAGYYPKLLLNGRYGYSGSSNSFRDSAVITSRLEPTPSLNFILVTRATSVAKFRLSFCDLITSKAFCRLVFDWLNCRSMLCCKVINPLSSVLKVNWACSTSYFFRKPSNIGTCRLTPTKAKLNQLG